MHPINKKYFGNRNIGTNGYTNPPNNSVNAGDDEIGGEGVASYNAIVAGSGWTAQPTASISPPAIPGGVTATGTFHYTALSMAVTANGTGFNFGDLVEVNTGTATTKARGTVAAITAVAAEVNAPGDGYAVGDVLVYSTGFASNVTVTVTSISDPDVNGFGPITGISLTAPGQRTSVAPTNPVSHNNVLGGSGCTVNFTWGVYSLSAPTVAGDYTVFPSTGASGVLVSVPVAGTGLKADVTMGLLSVAVTQKGSGYVNPADAALVFSPAATPTNASATAVLTTDSGSGVGMPQGNATNQENAIIIRAKTTSGGTVQIGDIIKQVNDTAYKIKTADGTKQKCILVADDTPAFGEAYVKATDSNGNTYYVTKLSAHVATVVQWTQNGAFAWKFANGARAKWTFAVSPDADQVSIENA